MPEAARETASAAADKKLKRDRVGEELADDATIWRIYDKLAKKDDERRTKSWDNSLNNLSLFAGLFSAITTAFIIEAQQDLEPDYARLTFLVLNATASGQNFVHQPFVVPPGARMVNCLWISSLILSLSAALIAIMGKDWIEMYGAYPVCNTRQWAEIRAYRWRCVDRWYMSEMIAAAPVLLHVSLLLFGAGLVVFISSDTLTHKLTLGLTLAAGVLYLIATLSAVAFSTSPFKSPATQMLRAALGATFSYMRNIIRTPKRNGRGSPTFLPGSTSRHPSAIISTAGRTAVAYMRSLPASLRTARRSLRGSGISIGDWFLSSIWTDPPSSPRPKLLAEAVAWLSVASQAPDVFRAIVFALGDLNLGPQVGLHASHALRTRLRSEIRRTWQQVDVLTFSRYVLADRNTIGDPVLEYDQFVRRFDLSKESTRLNEDGLAALIKIDPRRIRPSDLAGCFPGHVTQPRMPEFLLPHLRYMEDHQTDALILVSNLYKIHLWTHGSASLDNLEEHLYRGLATMTRRAYATEVTDRYGGRPGVVELLTFLCCRDIIDEVTKTAAVDLIMELLEHLPFQEHRCLAYLFGTSELWNASWKDKRWSSLSLYCLSRCLGNSARAALQPDSVRSSSDDQNCSLALSSVAGVRFGSVRRPFFVNPEPNLRFGSGWLCEPEPEPSEPVRQVRFRFGSGFEP